MKSGAYPCPMNTLLVLLQWQVHYNVELGLTSVDDSFQEMYFSLTIFILA